MAYSDFTYPSVLENLDLTRSVAPLFRDVPSVPASATLAASLRTGAPLAATVATEFARNVWMVGPVLLDLWARYDGRVGLYAGTELYADPANGLTGSCDFLLTRSPQQPIVPGPPVVVVAEAKRESVERGFGPCIAGMVGAQRANRQAKADIDPLYGCSTTGTVWKFLRLSRKEVTVDLDEYTLPQIDRILGILTHVLGPVPAGG
jgi:hypothetical protein